MVSRRLIPCSQRVLRKAIFHVLMGYLHPSLLSGIVTVITIAYSLSYMSTPFVLLGFLRTGAEILASQLVEVFNRSPG